MKKGEPGDEFYIIEEGTFSIFDDKKTELARVGKGSCFGELALIKQDVRAANVVALTDAKVFRSIGENSESRVFALVPKTSSKCVRHNAWVLVADPTSLEI